MEDSASFLLNPIFTALDNSCCFVYVFIALMF